MSKIVHPELFRAVYEGTRQKLAANDIPTDLLFAGRTLLRAFDRTFADPHIKNGVFRRQDADNALIVRDQNKDVNRFTGLSGFKDIPSFGGLYCSAQQQATVNEIAHYTNAPGASAEARIDAGLNSRCIVKIRLLTPFLVADLSPHNPGAKKFLHELELLPAVQSQMAAMNTHASLWELVYGGYDYSVARGVGLAIAGTRYLRGLLASTARVSERSPDEKGDNVIFFGNDGQKIPGLSIVDASLFEQTGGMARVGVAFRT